MSVREERLILAAAVTTAMGRDDRHTPESAAAYAVARADALLSRLDDTEPEEDSDDDDDSASDYERGYDAGVDDYKEERAAALRQMQGLQAELADARAAALRQVQGLQAELADARAASAAPVTEVETRGGMNKAPVK